MIFGYTSPTDLKKANSLKFMVVASRYKPNKERIRADNETSIEIK